MQSGEKEDRIGIFELLLKRGSVIFFPAVLFFAAAIVIGIPLVSILAEMERELSGGVRLVVPGEDIRDEDMAACYEFEGVSGMTPVYEINAVVKLSNYSEDLVLKGIDKGFVEEEFIIGDVFPEEGREPLMVINEAALKNLRDAEGGVIEEKKLAETDWLSLAGTLSLDDIHIEAKVCGVIDGGEEGMPAAYVSRECGKALLEMKSENAVPAKIWIDVSRLKYYKKVRTALAGMGYMVENYDRDKEYRWELLKGRAMDYGAAFLISFMAGWLLVRERLRFLKALTRKE